MRQAKPWWQKYAWGIAFWVGLIFLMGLGIDALNRDAEQSRREQAAATAKTVQALDAAPVVIPGWKNLEPGVYMIAVEGRGWKADCMVTIVAPTTHFSKTAIIGHCGAPR